MITCSMIIKPDCFCFLCVRCVTMSVVTLRAAQRKRPTFLQKTLRLVILPKEKTAPTVTVLLPKPGLRTTTAGDVQPEPGSPLSLSQRALSVWWHSSCKAHVYIHTYSHFTHTLHWQWAHTDWCWWTDNGYADTDLSSTHHFESRKGETKWKSVEANDFLGLIFQMMGLILCWVRLQMFVSMFSPSFIGQMNLRILVCHG